jgi:enoyl-CoA hydratase
MPESDLVLFSVADHVALITVNDPERRNAVTGEMSKQLRAAVERAEADPDVHAVVVTGAGKAFCAGADLSALGSAAEQGLQQLYDGFMAVGKCALPTIAAVNGPAVGAGLNLALAADVRIAGPNALFDSRFQKLGIHPREVVLATKATMRATASPGSLDVELHELAKDTELGPQATSIQSPEFAARLAAAKRK